MTATVENALNILDNWTFYFIFEATAMYYRTELW